MKALIISLLFLTATPYCFAQSCGTLKKGYAYYNVSLPGMQMVDENGNAVNPKANITRFIYIEYSGTKMPDIKTVLYNNAELQFSVTPVTAKTVLVGDKKLNPNNRITTKKGNSFLKIDLQPADGKAMPDTGCKSITIKSKASGKLCSFIVSSEKEFATPPMY
jgi:hypothetical protein